MSDKIIIPGSRANLTAELREQVIENGKLRRALAETTETIKSYAAQDAQILAAVEDGASKLAACREMLEDTMAFVDAKYPMWHTDTEAWDSMRDQIAVTLKKVCGP